MDGKKTDKVTKFKENARALNEQFVSWANTQMTEKPDKLLTAGVSDYLRHCAKLRFQYSDIIAAEGKEDEEAYERKTDGGTSTLFSLAPLSQTKIVHFVRHGEGWHNIGIINMDARLTENGWAQSHSLGAEIRIHYVTRSITTVVVSPLTRALETAAGIFGESEYDNGNRLLMREQAEVHDSKTKHVEVYSRSGIKYIAHELCRERLGPSNCDARRPKSELEYDFPGVDFSMIVDGPDPHWKTGNVERESAVASRGHSFIQFLMSLPDTNIAVVTHSAFLWFTLTTFGNELASALRESMHKWYENGEMRSLLLTDGGKLKDIDITHFPRGAVEPRSNEPQQSIMGLQP